MKKILYISSLFLIIFYSSILYATQQTSLFSYYNTLNIYEKINKKNTVNIFQIIVGKKLSDGNIVIIYNQPVKVLSNNFYYFKFNEKHTSLDIKINNYILRTPGTHYADIVLFVNSSSQINIYLPYYDIKQNYSFLSPITIKPNEDYVYVIKPLKQIPVN